MNSITRLGLALGLILALLAGGEAHAANLWDGGGADNNWGTATNWDDDAVPANLALLTFAGMTRLTPNNDLARTNNAITFYGDAGAFTIGGNTFTLNGNITNNSTTVQTINNNITLRSATRTVTSVFGAGTVLGGIIGDSGSGLGLTRNGVGTVTLKGDNTFTGTVTLNGAGGILQIGHDNALGLGPVTLTAGTLQPVDGARTLAATKAITVTDHIISGAQNLTFDGKVTGAGGGLSSRSLESSLDAGKVLTLAGGLDVAAEAGTELMFLAGRGDTTIGVISNGLATTGHLRFRNAGTTTLQGTNTYNGYTVIGGGGTMILDYGTANGGKFHDTNVLNLAYDGSAVGTMGGVDLVLKGGSHTEVVGSVNAVQAGQSNVRRDGGTSVLQMNAFSVNPALGSINFAENDIATCDNANTNGILMTGLGGFAPLTVGGTDWAYNSTGGADGPIQAYTGYLPMPLTGGAGTANYIQNGSATLTGNLQFNTLKLTGNGTLALGATGDKILFSGTFIPAAILYAGTAGQTYTITDDNTGTPGGGTPGTGQIGGGGGGLYDFGVYVNAGELIFDVDFADGIPIKAGQGRMTLNQAGTFKTGPQGNIGPQVNEGALRLRHSNAVSNRGIAVNASVFGSALELNKDTANAVISIPTNAALSILGSGISNGGALRNIAGNNTYGGAITIGSSGSGLGIGARINSDADTLAITNGITTAAGRDVTLGGVGNITVSTIKITGAGAVNKDGEGTLTLAAVNDYTGNTTVNAGTLTVSGSGSIAAGSKVMVNASGTLSGSGTCHGDVRVQSNGTIRATGGNLTVSNLVLYAGSKLAVDGVNKVIVANPGAVATTAGLTILPGAQVQLTGNLSDNTYPILDYSGDLKGSATNLTVLNPESGRKYEFVATGSAVEVTVKGGVGTLLMVK